MDMRFKSCEGIYYDKPKEIEVWNDIAEGGYFWWYWEKYKCDVLMCMPPCVDLVLTSLPVNTEGSFNHWVWDGNREKPTLEPSIGIGINQSLWHGYLKSGYWEACE